MNIIKLSIFTLAFCATGMAHAGYSCISHDGKTTLTMNENHMTRVGNTSVIIESDQENITYYGVTEVSDGRFMTKKVVNLFYYNGFFTIVEKPKFCGRGSCDYNSGPIITGKLELNNSETYFSCNE